MSYIVFDLEWNQPYAYDVAFLRRVGTIITGEVIQIGAVRIDETGAITDSFNVIVKPKFLKRMHKHISGLTGISSLDLETGMPFPNAFNLFLKWCGDNPRILSWGIDDMLVLKQNIRLHHLKPWEAFEWFDAQRIYAQEVWKNSEQVSLEKALEERKITQELSSHNAFHDAVHTAKILASLPIKKDISHYRELMDKQPSIAIFPEEILFLVYDGFSDKKEALSKPVVVRVFCPKCKRRMTANAMERINGDRYLAIGKCEIHGSYAIQWKIGKYMEKKKGTRFYTIKTMHHISEEIEVLYEEKAKANRIKEEKMRVQWKEKKRKEKEET